MDRGCLLCLIVAGEAIAGSGCGFPRPADVPGDDNPNGSGVDASTARCDPSKPFGTPTVLPTLNSSFDEVSFALSRDELTAFIGRENTGNPPTTLSVATRASVTDAFDAPAIARFVGAINDADGDEHNPSPTSDTLVLYFHRQTLTPDSIGVFAALRAGAQSSYDTGSLVSVGGAGLINALIPVISSDGQTLYWIDFQQFYLHAARREDTSLVFDSATSVSSIPIHNPVLSRDELTLYYSDGDATDILASTRASISEPFGTGIPVANVNSAQKDAPVYLTEDGCILYLSSTRPGGAGGFDLWEASRPL